MFSYLILVISIISIALIILIINAIHTNRRMKIFLQGANAKSLEKVIIDMQNRINENQLHATQNTDLIRTLNEKMRKRIRNIQTMRFKPFEDAGSTQSFAIAIIDDDNNGVVLSSLYTRERMSVFAKPVRAGKSEYELTNEEKTVLESAKQEV